MSQRIQTNSIILQKFFCCANDSYCCDFFSFLTLDPEIEIQNRSKEFPKKWNSSKCGTIK